MGLNSCGRTSLLPRSCAVSCHLTSVGVLTLTCGSPATGKGSVSAGAGPQVMAAPRNTALNLNRLDGNTNIARAQRQANWQPSTALEAIHAA